MPYGDLSIFLLFLLVFSLHICFTFSYSVALGYSVLLFFFPTICFLCFSVFNDSIAIFPSSDILVFSHVQSTNKPIKGIVQFCYSGFIFNSRFFSPDFGSLLEFPSLCLYYPSVLACYLLY